MFKKIFTWLTAATAETKKAYAASGVTATISVLTFNQVIGAIGVVLSVSFAGFTTWSNHQRNKKHIELMNHQMKTGKEPPQI